MMMMMMMIVAATMLISTQARAMPMHSGKKYLAANYFHHVLKVLHAFHSGMHIQVVLSVTPSEYGDGARRQERNVD
jgi:hypothetical protein